MNEWITKYKDTEEQNMKMCLKCYKEEYTETEQSLHNIFGLHVESFHDSYVDSKGESHPFVNSITYK